MRRRRPAELNPIDEGRWFKAALDRLHSLRASGDERLATVLVPGAPALIARAPGRLDVMGGIADYSGSLVLELPLARSTYAILQPRADTQVQLVSFRGDRTDFFSTRYESLTTGELASPERLRECLSEGESWAAYVLGIVQLCARMAGAGLSAQPRGMSIVLGSDVPEGKGVSSSAALEVATMAVVSTHFGLELEAEGLAVACQWVENHVVGAPCGIMDQITSVSGRADRLLRLRCQPAIIEGHVKVPPGFRFFGIDSGVRHAVTGDDYVVVRTAAFMGYRIIAHAAGLSWREAGGRVAVDDPRWGGYLANIPPDEFDANYLEILPERMTGAEFVAHFGGHTDPATRLIDTTSYPVRQATLHPIRENARVERFAALLSDLRDSPAAAEEMGRLMAESHASYAACGLGSAGTDRLVDLVREAGEQAGLFGAKITGGGSGGTVVVFGRSDAERVVSEIAARYGEEVGVRAEVFAESGPGAEITGILEG